LAHLALWSLTLIVPAVVGCRIDDFIQALNHFKEHYILTFESNLNRFNFAVNEMIERMNRERANSEGLNSQTLNLEDGNLQASGVQELNQ
jgi:predicted sugar kinase